MNTLARRLKNNSRFKRRSALFSNTDNSGFFEVQHKLKVGEPDDKYEKEADRIADKVVDQISDKGSGFFKANRNADFQGQLNDAIMEKPLADSISPLIQKQEEEEELQAMSIQKQEEEEEELQAMSVQKQEEEEEELQAMTIQKQEEEEELQAMSVQKQEEEEEELQAMSVQKQEEEEEGLQAMSVQKQEEEEEIQTKMQGQSEVTNSVETRLKNKAGKGNKMDKATKVEMENQFGADFNNVNIHTDAQAVQMSKEFGAQAFTHGNDVYFNEGKYKPGSKEGKHLLAHELTHTIQQTGNLPAKVQYRIGDGNDLQSTRFSGNVVLEACLDNEQSLRMGSNGTAVSLVQQALVDAGYSLPQFGVDGIFGNETRTALQNFQRASSLSVDGVVGPGTMSALDALYSGGAPALPPAIPVVPTPTTPPTISTQTIKSAPDGTSDTRTTVGVGERVRFTANTSGAWSVSEAHIIGPNNGTNMVWEAPATAASPTITCTTPGGTQVTPFTVIAPNALSMTVGNRHAIAAGTAGACMLTNVVVNPLNVNFGRTQWLEVPGPATNVSGYFNRFPAATIFHNPNPNYLPFNDSNSGLRDHAAWHGVPAPFSFGTFEWVIPNRYKIDGESDARGRVFTNTIQAFYMFSGGTMMIDKAGATVIRLINNTIF